MDRGTDNGWEVLRFRRIAAGAALSQDLLEQKGSASGPNHGPLA